MTRRGYRGSRLGANPREGQAFRGREDDEQPSFALAERCQSRARAADTCSLGARTPLAAPAFTAGSITGRSCAVGVSVFRALAIAPRIPSATSWVNLTSICSNTASDEGP